MFQKIGNFTVKYRYFIVSAWILLAVAMFFFAPSLSTAGSMDESAFLPDDTESLRARQLINEYFPESSSGSTITLVFFNENGLNDADMAYAQAVSAWILSDEAPFEPETIVSIFSSPELETQLISPDHTTMLLNIGLVQSAFEPASEEAVKAIRNYLKAAPDNLEVYVSGQVAIYTDLMESLMQSIDMTTIVTIVLIIVLLLAIYRSPLSVLVPLTTIGVSYLVSRGLLGFIAEAGVSVWSQLDIFIIVLVFGVGTDYCLFLISRYREELYRYNHWFEAMKHTIGRIGEVIAASAFAVIVGLSAMAVARYQMIQTMGPLLGLCIFITLLAALTLAPALASIFGKVIFWPRHAIVPGKPHESRFWGWIGQLATGKPVAVITILLVILLIPCIAIPGMNRSYDQLAEIPPESESVAGFKVLQEHYEIGRMDPLTAVMVGGDDTDLTAPETLIRLKALLTSLQEIPGIADVQSILTPEGNNVTPELLTVAGQLTAVNEGLSSALAGGETDPSFIFNEELDISLSRITAYLDEIAAGFPPVIDTPPYQEARYDIAAIQSTIDEIRQSALVENQLKILAGQVELSAAAPTDPSGMVTPETAGLILLIKGYLDELSGTYSDIKTMPAYITADTIAGSLAFALSSGMPFEELPAEIQLLMYDLPGSLRQMAADLFTLSDTLQGQNRILFSAVLTEASSGSSAHDQLQALISSFSQHLEQLASWFIDQGNPVFISNILLASNPEGSALINTFYSQNRQAMRFYIVLDSFPQSDEAIKSVNGIRQAINASLTQNGLNIEEFALGGTSAEIADINSVLDSDFNIIMIVVIAAVFVVLVLLLRSLVAPIYLLLTVLLSYVSTLGITSWLFQSILGHDGISFLVPIIVFALLVALGSDYNIFLMSRVREESAAHPPHMAARLAVIATGGVITACGIILAGTFSVLALTPIRTAVHIGVAVSIGILLDTFLVRALLVPAIASLLGKWNWWPRHIPQK